MGAEMNILSFGGGTNSTALLIKLVELSIPVEAVLFADTGGEKPHTYKHVEDVDAWLRGKTGQSITIVRAGGRHRTLEQSVLDNGVLPSLAFGFRTCSQRWKKEPQEKWIQDYEPARALWAVGGKVVKLIGIDAGEPRRAKQFETDRYVTRYPLVEWGIDRESCIEIIKAAGLSLPGKSSCFFCPASKKSEVVALQSQYPDLAKRALYMEANAFARGKLGVVKGLGRHWSWTDILAGKDEGVAPPTELPCDCMDESDE